ncbi:MAG: hypothetical protein L6Q54_03290 [Leptospiraceae bacterium]|nr:hypothetical protein [Leptospiraceae bacterium]MCK6380261.1 hypothetical protein [Leptospiraceae bacterium]
MKIWKFFITFFILLFCYFQILSCTNYTVSKQSTVPPILVSVAHQNTSSLSTVTVIPSGYLLVFKAGNPEIFFADYKLFVGNTENEARNPPDINKGTGCTGGPQLTPNQPIEYSAEISSQPGGLAPVNPGENTNRICKFQVTVSSGQYIAIRSALRSVSPIQTSNTLNISASSNALIIP